MEKIQKFNIQTDFRIKDNIQFLFIDNCIISVKKTQTNVYEFHFYNTKNFEKEFVVKNENEENLDYKNFEIFHTKNKDLYLLGHSTSEGMKIMKINEKKIEKREFYNYDCYRVDLQDDKIYIIKDESLIIYDILKNTSIKINDAIMEEDYFGQRFNKQLFLVDKYLLFSYTRQYRFNDKFWGLHYQIINKNSYTNYIDESGYEDGDFSLYHDAYDDNFYNFEYNEYFNDACDKFFFKWKYCIGFFLYQISKNLFYITNEDNDNEKLYFVEINKNIINSEEYNILYHIEKKDKIVDNNPIYLIDNEKFSIKSLENIYIYKISGFELIFKFQLKYPSIHLIKFQDKNEKYKIILADKERVLFLTS